MSSAEGLSIGIDLGTIYSCDGAHWRCFNAMKPTNTIFDAKRLIGRKCDGAVVQSDMKRWPFKVISDDGKPKVQVEYKGETKAFYPEDISSMVLGHTRDRVCQTQSSHSPFCNVLDALGYFHLYFCTVVFLPTGHSLLHFLSATNWPNS
uniref:Heat shock protein 70 n=1 Tax=Cyclopterus lumpus TaxID=8103 RepID=A0A8C2Z720_CYCLU